MTTERTYSVEVLQDMQERYTVANTDAERAAVVDHFDAETGFGVKSIRGKMQREGYYIAKAKRAKNGAPAERKAAIVADIAKLMLVPVAKIESLESAGKQALQLVREYVQMLKDDVEARDLEASDLEASDLEASVLEASVDSEDSSEIS